MSVSALVEGLWGVRAPADAARTTRTYVSRLRKAYTEDLVVPLPPGYALRREPDAVDAARFERRRSWNGRPR